MKWRTLEPEEAARAEHARLGGALVTCVAIACAVVGVVAAGLCFAPERLAAIGHAYTIAVVFAGLWSAVFVTMTLLRLRRTPEVASAGLALWVLYRLIVVLGSGGLPAQWPLLVDMLVEAAAITAFAAYLTAGLRPNAYFRRRVPAG